MATYLMRGARSDTGEWVTWTAEDAPDLTGADYPDGGDEVITDASITVVRRIDGGGAVADGAVTEAKLADEAVSGAKLKTSDAAALRTALGLGDAATRSTGIAPTNVVLGNDTRLSDPRTPSSHTHTVSDLTDGGAVGGPLVRTATEAEARALISAARGTRTAAPFASGQGWTISAGVGATVGSSAWTYVSGNKARCTLATTGTVHAGDDGTTGPRIERAFTYRSDRRYKFSVQLDAESFSSVPGEAYCLLYARDSSLNYAALTKIRPTPVYVLGGGWGAIGAGGNITSPAATWDGGTRLILTLADPTMYARFETAGGVVTNAHSRSIPFTPTHVGVMGCSYLGATGYFEVSDLVIDEVEL